MKCEYCGNEFKPKKRNAKYCKKDCKKKARYLRRRDKVLLKAKQWRIDNSEEYKKRTKMKNDKAKKRRESWSEEQIEEFLSERKDATTKWRNANREKYRESLKKYYYKNKVDKKDKWICISITSKISYKDNWKRICKKCQLKENLQIHHEIYPKGTEKIKQAYKEGKIYFVCYDCHKKIHKNLRKNEN